MIMKKLIRTLLCCLLFLLSTGMYAQKGLQIASVFQKYGNEKGATYVELSKMLSKTWDITHYQSLKLSKAEKALPDIYRCLEADRDQRGNHRWTYSIGILSAASDKRQNQSIHIVPTRKERRSYAYLYRRRNRQR